MFSRMINKYKYNRFVKKWSRNENAYRSLDYFNDLRNLFNVISDINLSEQYDEYHRIASSSATVIDWLDACGKSRVDIQRKTYKPGPPPVYRDIALSDYLMTKDNHQISYVSALNATLDELYALHAVIATEKLEVSRDYYYLQLRELFVTGIAFVMTAIQGEFNQLE